MPPTNFSINFSDGSIVTAAHLAEGRDGWGVDKIEITLNSPVRPDFLARFMTATAEVLLTGGLERLIQAHDEEELPDAIDASDPTLNDLYWHCACGSRYSRYDSQCPSCGSPAPEEAGVPPEHEIAGRPWRKIVLSPEQVDVLSWAVGPGWTADFLDRNKRDGALAELAREMLRLEDAATGPDAEDSGGTGDPASWLAAQAAPRGIDPFAWSQMPPVIQAAVRAHYVSTYCMHAWIESDADLHGACRIWCKFGQDVERCLCPCHEAP